MEFPFSQREKARAAALEAAERYPRESSLPTGETLEFWGFVINAALGALDERPRTARPQRPEPELTWVWSDLDKELENLPFGVHDNEGWVAVTKEDNAWTAIVYQAQLGKRARVEAGSLEMETDCDSWGDGKHVCEAMLRHARACNAELSL
jgi:hypothetical protein